MFRRPAPAGRRGSTCGRPALQHPAGPFFSRWDGCSLDVVVSSSIRLAAQWEKAVVFRLGKFHSIKGPGLFMIIPLIDQLRMVDTRVLAVNIPKQQVITRDNVPVTIDGVLFFRVDNAAEAIIMVQDYRYVISQYAQTSLRDVIGQMTLDQLLTEREEIAKSIEQHVEKDTKGWGLEVTGLRIQDIDMPEELKKMMSRQASAEREKRATITKAEGDKEAAVNLSLAARTMAESPGAMQLRTLQTIDGLGPTASNTVVLAVPIDVLESLGSLKDAFRSRGPRLDRAAGVRGDYQEERNTNDTGCSSRTPWYHERGRWPALWFAFAYASVGDARRSDHQAEGHSKTRRPWTTQSSGCNATGSRARGKDGRTSPVSHHGSGIRPARGLIGGRGPEWGGCTALVESEGRGQTTWTAAPTGGSNGPGRREGRGRLCASCHTSLPIALARPSLGRQLGEATAGAIEKKLIDNMKKRVENWETIVDGATSDKDPFQCFYSDKEPESLGTEAVLNALILVNHDARRKSGVLSTVTQKALGHLWEQQQEDGAWAWLDFGLNPWEKDGAYYGASLAAVAVGSAGKSYYDRAEVRPRSPL